MGNGRRLANPGTRDLLFMALTLSSGAIDAISYLGLDKVFTAFMTGNIVFLGLQASGVGGFNFVRVIASLAVFSAGCLLSARIAKTYRGVSRASDLWPRPVIIALGASAVAQAGFLAIWIAFDGRPSNGVSDALTGLWAFAMGLQSAAILTLEVRGVVTTAATGTVVALMGHLAARPRSATEERRLAGVLAALFAGAAAGGLLLRHARAYAPAFPLVVTALSLVIAARALGEDESAEDEMGGEAPGADNQPVNLAAR